MSDSWHRAYLALSLLAGEIPALGGATIRMRAGPDRDQLVAHLKSLFPEMVRLAPSVDDTHLFGGINIAETLGGERTVRNRGLLDRPQIICLAMAERCPPHLAARLAQYLDQHPTALILALDEGADETESLPQSLSERLAFRLEPEGHAPEDLDTSLRTGPKPHFFADHAFQVLTEAAARFGVASLRAPTMALATARALAARETRLHVSDTDLATAAALVFAHRATRIPQEDPPSETAQQPDTAPPDDTDRAGQQDLADLPKELVVEAIKTFLPPEILAGLGQNSTARTSSGQGVGQKRQGNRRGRPLPSRPGRLDGRNRLDLLATLRAAAPWQPLRRKLTPERDGLLLRPADFRVKRAEVRSDRLVVFAVDASGSSAVTRLNEAKGAVELLLARAYSARDHVALISFREDHAETLLPPTRSLVQTRRKLSTLPGGGGTPLAAGLEASMHLAVSARSRGMTPVVVVLTDGKANIALDGTADRQKAGEDAVRMAHVMRRAGLDVLTIDIAIRPHPKLRDLAQHLDATYLPLPRANAHNLTGAVTSILDSA